MKRDRNRRATRILAFGRAAARSVLLATALIVPALFQVARPQPRPVPERPIPVILANKVLFAGDVPVMLKGRRQALHVSVRQLALSNGSSKGQIEGFDKAGFAIVQGLAGDIRLAVNGERIDINDGKWAAFPVPADVALATDTDTVSLDAIILQP